jgi:replicative DNA helicase
VTAQPNSHHAPQLVAQDRDAERAVLGSIMIRRSALDEAEATGLSSRHFYLPAHETIYATMLDAAAAGHPVDSVSLADHLLSRGVLDGVGGAAYLHQCVQAVSTTHNVDYWAEIVFERYILRSLDQTGLRFQQMATGDGEGDVSDLVGRARTLMDELTMEAAANNGLSGDAITEALELLTERRYVKTPWRDLNAAVGGWVPGHLIVVGARPSVGKTTVACNIVLDAMHRGWLPLFISGEMPKGEVVLKILSNMASVSGDRILHRSLRPEDEAAMDTAARALRQMPHIIDDRSNLSVSQVKAAVRAAKRHGMPVLLVHDYMQIARPADKRADRYQQVGDIAQDFKNLAKDEDVPAVVLAQLKRGLEERAVPVPTLSDLRESGGIEQAADTIALLHRQTRQDFGDISELVWFIGKSRHGRVVQFPTRFDGEFSRVLDREVVR